MYLKVVYTCGKPLHQDTKNLELYHFFISSAVPRKVLKEQYEGALEPDETEDEFSNDEDDDFDIYDAGNEFIRESAASPPAPNIEGIAKDNFTKDINDISPKSPPHKSNGFDFGKYAYLCLVPTSWRVCPTI